MRVSEALVAGVVAIVDSVTDVRGVDALAAGQTMKRAVQRAASTGQTSSFVRTAAAIIARAAASSWTHRCRVHTLG